MAKSPSPLCGFYTSTSLDLSEKKWLSVSLITLYPPLLCYISTAKDRGDRQPPFGDGSAERCSPFLTGVTLSNHVLVWTLELKRTREQHALDRWDYLWKRPHPSMCWSQWWPKCHQSCQRPWVKLEHLFQHRSLLLAEGALKGPRQLETPHLWQNWAAGCQTPWSKEAAHYDDLSLHNNASFFSIPLKVRLWMTAVSQTAQ